MSIRSQLLAPLALCLLGATPAAAQVSIGVHIDLPVLGRSQPRPPVVRRPAPPPRVLVVRDYAPRRVGEWRREARHWTPVVLWLSDGRYFEREVPRSHRVVVYHYRGEYFRDPGERAWREYRDRELRGRDEYRPAWRRPETGRHEVRRQDTRPPRVIDQGPAHRAPPPPQGNRARPREVPRR